MVEIRAMRPEDWPVGQVLMDALVATAGEHGIWTIQTSIFPENAASLSLHERVGFRVVGRRERIAELSGTWRDTILLELRLQLAVTPGRRSAGGASASSVASARRRRPGCARSARSRRP
jgi:ribosomal protein S18 acetylase RimI-like enzyme